MCIQTRIQQAIAEKAALDAQIAKLEELQIKTAPVKTLLSELLADYSDVAPEDLASVWQEILAIGGKFDLSVQPLVADELRQWEAANENERLRQELEKEKHNYQTLVVIDKVLNQQLEAAYAEVAELRSQLQQRESEFEAHTQNLLPNPEEEWFTATVARKDVENNDCSLAKCAEQVLNERAVQKQPEPIAEAVNTEPAKPETETNFEAMGFQVVVYPQYAGENLVGATFRVLTPEEMGADDKPRLVFATSLLAAEIGDRTWKTCAWDLIQDYRDKETAEKERIENPYKKSEDDFIEFVRLTAAVGYIKRRDNGELISAYAAFANRDAAGEKTATMTKPRAKKWAEHLHNSFESCGWKVEEPRKVKRMQSEPGAKQQFAYEIKIGGKFSIGQLQKLAEEDFNLLPNEIAVKPAEPLTAPTPNFRVIVNGFEMASGKGNEVFSRFEEELAEFGDAGKTSVSLICGSEVVEHYVVADFNFIEAQDFDEENPEYLVLHRPTQTNFRVYPSLVSGTNWVSSIYPHNPLTTKEAAAVDGLRRQVKAQSAE